MRQWKIYNTIISEKPKNITFGCNDYFIQTVYIGTSRINSYIAGEFRVEKEEHNNHYIFSIIFNDTVLRKISMDKKTKEFKELIPESEALK